MAENECNINSVHVNNPVKEMVDRYVQNLAKHEADRLELEVNTALSQGARLSELTIVLDGCGRGTVTRKPKSIGRQMAVELSDRFRGSLRSVQFVIGTEEFQDAVGDAIDKAMMVQRARDMDRTNMRDYLIPVPHRFQPHSAAYVAGFEACIRDMRARLGGE